MTSAPADGTTPELDPFELPDWLGEEPVTWSSDGGVRGGHLVAGRLTGASGSLPCDLLAVDDAFPSPVVDDLTRTRAHQVWRHGEVLLVDRGGRATLAVPGTVFTADRVLDVLRRLARSVGAPPQNVCVVLRLE